MSEAQMHEETAPPELMSATEVRSLPDLARLLRDLRRRHARNSGDTPLTYRELAAKTGWSQAALWDYFAGRTLPTTNRFDELVRLLGATPAEQGALATARDRVEELRRQVPADPSTSDGLVVPRQLPPAVRHFTGREGELEILAGLLKQVDQTGVAALISTIGGMAGVGKTTLAVHWAHRVADRFGDGQLYVNMRGFDSTDSPMSAAEAVRTFLDALGIPPERIPAELDAQVGLYRSLIAGRRMLLLLDNARDADQVRPLLPGSPGCLVLVTSRNRLGSLVAVEGAEPMTLDLLTTDEARQLLARRLGDARITADPSAVSEVIAGCAGLPLALSILAARAAAQPGFPFASLAAELREARRSLDGFEGGETATSLRTVFSWSYQQVSQPAARLFRLLGLHPGPDIGVDAAASLAGQSLDLTRPMLAELIRAHMVAEPAPGRYTFHDLLRAYACDLVHRLDTDAERRAAIHRTLEHYIHSAHAAHRLLYPHLDPVSLTPPQPAVTVHGVTDHEHALTWFMNTHPVLLAVVRQAAGTGFDAQTCQLAWAVADYLNRRGHWRDLAETQRTALAAARRLADSVGQARAQRALGSAYNRLGRHDEALGHLENALALYHALGDLVGEAHAHLNVSEVSGRLGRHAQALRHARLAHELAQAAGHGSWRAKALNAIGWYHAQLGQYQPALANCRQALALQEEAGDRTGAADTWDSLGYIHHHIGEYQSALKCYRRALALWRKSDHRHGRADTLTNLGETLVALGQNDSAREAWRQALIILEDLGLPDAERVRAELHRLHPDASGTAGRG